MPKIKYTFQTTQNQYENIVVKLTQLSTTVYKINEHKNHAISENNYMTQEVKLKV
jgi:hypothetical protein